MNNYFMCRPRQRMDGRWYVHFYSRDKWPFYSGGVLVDYSEEAWVHFKRFIESAETHRLEYGLGV